MSIPPLDPEKKLIDKEKLKADGKRLLKKLTRKPLRSLSVIAVLTYILIHAPAWERKYQFYDLLNNGNVGAICLSHENSIFEQSGIEKSYASTSRYLRFDKQTFLHDFMNMDNASVEFVAVALDFDGVIYWSEMSLKENKALSAKYKIALGTCFVAKDFHRAIPGSALVTNN